MFNLDKFIADSVTFRPVSMFAADIESNNKQGSTHTGDKGKEGVKSRTVPCHPKNLS